MKQDNTLVATFTHQQLFQYTLTCTLDQSQHSLHLHMNVPTQTFPKIYQKCMKQIELPMQFKFVYENIVNIYRAIKNKNNIDIIYTEGVIRLKYSLSTTIQSQPQSSSQFQSPSQRHQKQTTIQQQQFSPKPKPKSTTTSHNYNYKYLQIKLTRCMNSELEQIRSQINQKINNIGDIDYIQGRIQKLWLREQSNQKIFLKFKEDVEYKIQQFGQRMAIQNTKINIIRQDVNKLMNTIEKLSAIVCPIFNKINIMSEWTNQFILQDRKIMYIGDSGTWTQILFKQELLQHRKYQFGFKIVNSKRNNIVAGVTVLGQVQYRSSLSAGKNQRGGSGNRNENERKFIGLSGMGHIYQSDREASSSELKNILLSVHHQSTKQREPSKQKQQKSSHEITQSSPMMTSSIIKSSKTQPNHTHSHHTYTSPSSSNATFQPMQIIKMIIQLDKDRITWKNGHKILMEIKSGLQIFRNQCVVPYFQFCDTGDSIQYIDL